MSTFYNQGTEFVFDGQTRRLIWDFAVIERVQEIYGEHPFYAIQGMFWEGKLADGTEIRHYQAKNVIDLTWIMLNNEVDREKDFTGVSELPKYTREQVAHRIDRVNMGDIVSALVKSWSDSMVGEADQDDGEEDTKNVKSAGRKSTRSTSRA